MVAVTVAGFATLALQVISPRLLHPSYGSGTEVAATVIALSLAGLALGYWYGGRAPWPPLRLLSAILTVGGLYLLALSLFGTPAAGSGFGLAVSALVVNGVPSFLFGLVSPTAVRAIGTSSDYPSRTAGLVFGIGTLANVVGGLTAGYALVPFVGLTRSLVGMGLALVLSGIALGVATTVATRTPTDTDAQSDDGDAAGPAPDERPSAAAAATPATGASGWTDGVPWRILALAFYSGVASVAIEVGASRMLASVFGPTTSLWAAVLAVSLGGLAVGYLLAGLVPDGALRQTLVPVVLTNCLWLFGAAWFISSLAPTAGPPLATNLIITLFAFFVPFVLFGLEAQILVGLAGSGRPPEEAARVTGFVFAVSTVGGILGAATGILYLLPTLGISTFVQAAAVGYLAMLWLAIGTLRSPIAPALAFALLAPLPAWQWTGITGTLLAQREGRYQTIRIYTDEVSYLRFHLGPTFESEVDVVTGEPRFGYAQSILNMVGPAQGMRVLVIGGAGHAMAAAFERRGAEVTEVELDPLVSELSDEHFGPILGEVVNTDGRRFLAEGQADVYDIVIVDAFAGPQVIPAHLTTVEFFTEIERALTPTGVMYMNSIGRVQGEQRHGYEALSSTVHEVFDFAAREGEAGNIILMGSEAPLLVGVPIEPTTTPLTDDLNPIEILLERSR